MQPRERVLKTVFQPEYLMTYGYFDFIPNSGEVIENKLTAQYGRLNNIYVDYLNLNELFTKGKGVMTRELADGIDFKTKTQPVEFTIPKSKNSQRLLKYPNIYSYIQGVKLLNSADFADSIKQILLNDVNSTSNVFNINPFNYKKTAAVKERLLLGSKYYLSLDFSAFGADVKIMDRFFRHRKVPLPRKIFKTRISA